MTTLGDPENGATDPAGKLSHAQQTGAILAAGGLSASAIARSTRSRKSDALAWHRDPDFCGAVERHHLDAMRDLEAAVSDLRLATITAAKEAVSALRDGLTATTAAGTPAWGARIRAGEALLTAVGRLVGPRDVAAEPAGPSSAVIVVRPKDDDAA